MLATYESKCLSFFLNVIRNTRKLTKEKQNFNLVNTSIFNLLVASVIWIVIHIHAMMGGKNGDCQIHFANQILFRLYVKKSTC